MNIFIENITQFLTLESFLSDEDLQKAKFIIPPSFSNEFLNIIKNCSSLGKINYEISGKKENLPVFKNYNKSRLFCDFDLILPVYIKFNFYLTDGEFSYVDWQSIFFYSTKNKIKILVNENCPFNGAYIIKCRVKFNIAEKIKLLKISSGFFGTDTSPLATLAPKFHDEEKIWIKNTQKFDNGKKISFFAPKTTFFFYRNILD